MAGAGVLGVAVAGALAVLLLVRSGPSNERDWVVDHARPAEVAVSGEVVHISGLRDFRHGEDAVSRERYLDQRYAVGEAVGVWFALAPFAERFRGLAHSFVSFEFADGRFVSVSVEARREADEEYGIMGGVMRAFELTYVVGTEEDLIGQRAVRGDTLYLYPSVATPEQAGALFRDMMERASALYDEPEFYNTLTNNCVTNLRDHVNRIAPEPLPWGWGILLPGFSDDWARKNGLLATTLGLEEARGRFRVDHRAREALDAGEGFSTRIRAGFPG
jgi:hypothetical protein